MNAIDFWQALDRFGFEAVRILLAGLWQSSILITAVGLLLWLLRRRRASLRHALLVAAILLAPILPMLSFAALQVGTPQVRVQVLPSYTAPRVSVRPVTVAPPPPPAAESAGGAPHAEPPSALEAKQAAFSPFAYPWALAFLGYCTGLLLVAGWITLGRTRIRQWVASAAPSTDERVLRIFRSAKESVGLRSHLLVLESDRVPTPLTAGVFHPVVLLPRGLAAGLSDAELRAVALHETTHVRRRDPLVLEIISIVRALFFFHPLIWLAARQITSLTEQVADDTVLDATGEPLPYARMLARFAEQLPRQALSTEVAAGMALSRSAFLSRVRSILSDRRDRIRRLSRLATAATVLAGIASIALAAALPLGEKVAKVDQDAPSTDETQPRLSPRRGGYALSFDGTDDFIEVPDSEMLDIGDEFAVELWVKVREAMGERSILSKEVPWESGYTLIVAESGIVVEGGLSTIPELGELRKARHESDRSYALTFGVGDGSGFTNLTAPEELGKGVIEKGKWHHVAAIWSKGSASLYVDGELVGVHQFEKAVPARVPLRIGKGSADLGRHFAGEIDELRIWNVARTQGEIQRYMERTVAEGEPGIVACWTFDEGKGQLARDTSPNSLQARLGSFPERDDADPKWIPVEAKLARGPSATQPAAAPSREEPGGDLEKLLRIPVSLEVAKSEADKESTIIRDALDEIGLQTGLNIFLPNTLLYEGVRLADWDAPLSVLVDVEAKLALDLFVAPYGFGYQPISANTIIVVPSEGDWVDKLTKGVKPGQIDEVLRIPVSLEITKPEADKDPTTIRDALDEIGLQTGLNIFVPNTLLYEGVRVADWDAPISFLVDLEAKLALRLFLEPFGYTYKPAGESTVVVIPK